MYLFFIALFLATLVVRYARKVKLAFIALFLTTLVVRYARKVILSIVLRETFLWDII